MLIILILAISICVGALFQKFGFLRHIERTTTWTVWLLIFVFGISLGSNEEIVNDFAYFGLEAFLIALAGVIGSVFASWAVGRLIDKNKQR